MISRLSYIHFITFISMNELRNIDGKEIEFTNLNKILYPAIAVKKSDVLDYYQHVSNYLLEFGVDRLLSLLRCPGGVTDNCFFQRNKPSWAPDWIQSVEVGVEKTADYVLLRNRASLFWLIQIDTLEIHATSVKYDNLERPDLIIFDLDPFEGMSFGMLVEMAFEIKKILESMGIVPFVKTSGKKGIHLYCPVRAKHGFNEVFQIAHRLAQKIINTISSCTLDLSKSARKDEVLIDVYRNHPYQSMILPYSLRATDNATVSMPLTWKQLESIKSPSDFSIYTVADYLEIHGDPWMDMTEQAISLGSLNI